MKSIKNDLLQTALYLIIVLLITYIIINFIGQRTIVDGASMEPKLENGDNLIVDKVSYRFKDPKRFDIIVFPYQYKENTHYIKRIIGMPGEKIFIDDKGNIWVNDEILEESYGKQVMLDAGMASQPILLDKDEYFVLGDNRNHSSDSRDPSVGKIMRDDILGRAWVRIWPLSKMTVLKHHN